MITNSGYSEHGASRRKSSVIRWLATSKSPHEDISENVELLRTRSRDLYSGGAPLGRGAIERVLLNALGGGLRLNARIDASQLGMSDDEASQWCSRTEAMFDYWASSPECDYGRELNFYALQVLALRSVLLDGECLFMLPSRKSRMPYELTVQLISADRLMTPPYSVNAVIDEGVELDQDGNVSAYYIANRHPESELMHQSALEYRRIPVYDSTGARQIWHIYPRERIGQHRGVPFLAAVMEPLKQLSRYTDAELMAAVVSGMYAIFFEQDKRDDGAYGSEEYVTEQGLGEVPGLEGMSLEMMNGAIMQLPEGMKATSVSPGRPNQNFEQFVNALVRQVGGALGIPSELLFLHFTASYSASRGALLEAWKLFRYWRQWFSEAFCQPIYEEWLREAMSLGHITGDVGGSGYNASLYTWSEWIGPSQGQLNPVQEVEASILKVEHGFSTYQRETSELTGGDYELNAGQIRRERGILDVSGNQQ